MLVKIFRIIQKPIDYLFQFFILPPAIILLIYRKLGSGNLPLTTNRLKKIGVFPIRNHYYEPLFDDRQLKGPLSNDRSLPGLNLNINGQLEFLKNLNRSTELTNLNFYKKVIHDGIQFHMDNGTFGFGDADYLYQFIRTIKPTKIIEIGCGNSTKIATIALYKNKIENPNSISRHICIEPYGQSWLDSFNHVEVHRKCIEECEFDWATELLSGDLLFIDSSHIIRPQGDVLKEYLEILPLLSSGVYIHIHDIFTPKDYPSRWIVDDVLFWNEQYLLEALLSNSDRYEIVGALNYLKNNHFDALKSVCPYLRNSDEPGSFYIRVR